MTDKNSAYFSADNDSQKSRDESIRIITGGLAATGVGLALVSTQPAHAQSSASTTSLSAMITDLSVLVGVSVGLGVLVMGAAYGFSIIRKARG